MTGAVVSINAAVIDFRSSSASRGSSPLNSAVGGRDHLGEQGLAAAWIGRSDDTRLLRTPQQRPQNW
jgi:hypothetical protein